VKKIIHLVDAPHGFEGSECEKLNSCLSFRRLKLPDLSMIGRLITDSFDLCEECFTEQRSVIWKNILSIKVTKENIDTLRSVSLNGLYIALSFDHIESTKYSGGPPRLAAVQDVKNYLRPLTEKDKAHLKSKTETFLTTGREILRLDPLHLRLQVDILNTEIENEY